MSLLSKNFALAPAESKKDLFSPNQKLFWDRLFENKDTTTPLQRDDFKPEDFTSLLPFIWLGDLIFNEVGALIDVKVRVMGTKVSAIMGEHTNEKLITENNEKSYQANMKESHERFITLINEMYNQKIPIYSSVNYFEEGKEHIHTKGMMIPMCKNGNVVNMVLGYIEMT